MSETITLQDLPKRHISPSQVGTYRRCGKQYAFRYIDEIIEPPKGALIYGRGAHQGLEYGFKEQLKTGEVTPLKDVIDAGVDGLEVEFQKVPVSEVEFDKDEDPGKLKDNLVANLTDYDTTRTTLVPASVEETVEVGFKGKPFVLQVRKDLKTDKARLIDFKTAKRAPGEFAAEISEQLTAQNIADPDATGLDLHVMVKPLKTKGPRHMILESAPRTEEQKKAYLRDAAESVLGIRAGIFPGRDESMPGSPCSWCGYYERCKGKKRPGT